METNEWKYLLHILIYGIVHFVDLLANRNARGKGAGREGLPVLLVKTSILLNLVGDGHRRPNVSATYTDADQSNVTLSVSDEYKNDEAFVIMAGATQTAVRTSLAIANAIANIDENDEYTPIVTATYVAPTPAE